MISFEDFVKSFLKERSSGYYQKFWAGTALENGLTVKTPDGREVMVKPSDMHMVDLGDMSGNCMCGHAIRYEYYLAEIGPIGSKCIQTMTGLEGEDLRKILRGAEFARKDRDDLLRVKEHYSTFQKQLELDSFLKSIYELLTYGEIPEDIKVFIDNDFPMPAVMITKLRNILYKKTVETTASKRYGVIVQQPLIEYEEIYDSIERIILDCRLPDEFTLYGENKYCFETMKEIGDKVKSGKATDKAVSLFLKLVGNLKNEKFTDALYVLIKLSHFRDGIEEFWSELIKTNLTQALKWGLTEKQCEFILNKSASGKDGLAIRFKDYLEREIDTEIEEPEKPLFSGPSSSRMNLEHTIENPCKEIDLSGLSGYDDEDESNPFG